MIAQSLDTPVVWAFLPVILMPIALLIIWRVSWCTCRLEAYWSWRSYWRLRLTGAGMPSWDPPIKYLESVLFALVLRASSIFLATGFQAMQHTVNSALCVLAGTLFILRSIQVLKQRQRAPRMAVLTLSFIGFLCLMGRVHCIMHTLPDLKIVSVQVPESDTEFETEAHALRVVVGNSGEWYSKEVNLSMVWSYDGTGTQQTLLLPRVPPIEGGGSFPVTRKVAELPIDPARPVTIHKIEIESDDIARDNNTDRTSRPLLIAPVTMGLSVQGSRDYYHPLRLDGQVRIIVTNDCPEFRVQVLDPAGVHLERERLRVEVRGITQTVDCDASSGTARFTYPEFAALMEPGDAPDALRVIYVQGDVPLVHTVTLCRQ